MTEVPDYKTWCEDLKEEIVQLEKEREINEEYQDKLHDEIDNLRQIIALLTKEWL